jgi:hypothetical protein
MDARDHIKIGMRAERTLAARPPAVQDAGVKID